MDKTNYPSSEKEEAEETDVIYIYIFENARMQGSLIDAATVGEPKS